MQTEKVKVRILKPIGRYSPDTTVEVDKDEAEQLCTPRTVNLGGGKTSQHVCAMEEITYEDLKKKPAILEQLDAADMQKLGLKNIVETPKDTAFEAKLARIAKEEDFPAAPEEILEARAELKGKAKKKLG